MLWPMSLTQIAGCSRFTCPCAMWPCMQGRGPNVAVLLAPVNVEPIGVHGHAGPLHVRTRSIPVCKATLAGVKLTARGT